MNKALLRCILVAHGETQASIAHILGLSLSRVNAKINEKNGAQFTQNEIRMLKDHYDLSAQDVNSIFFA